jgi:hypothetical protein
VHPGYIATPLMRTSPAWVHVVLAMGRFMSRLGYTVTKTPEQVRCKACSLLVRSKLRVAMDVYPAGQPPERALLT